MCTFDQTNIHKLSIDDAKRLSEFALSKTAGATQEENRRFWHSVWQAAHKVVISGNTQHA